LCLQLTGSNLVTDPISIFPRAFIGTLGGGLPTVNYPNIVNVSGTNIVNSPSPVNIPFGGNLFTLESDSGYLIFSNGVNGAGSGREFALQGPASGEMDGPITQSSGDSVNVYKLGQGTWMLNGTSSYTGTTIVSNGILVINGEIDASPVTAGGGTLGGTGLLTGPLAVATGATLALGAGAPIGTLTVNNSLILQAGSFTAMQINQAAGTNDFITGLTGVSYGGTLVVTNEAGTLAVGDSFQLFSAAGSTNDFIAVIGALPSGLGWSFNPANGVLSVVVGVNTSPVNINATASSGTLTMNWPANHTGWRLLVQTNNLAKGLSANTNDWTTVSGSSGTNQVNITINPTKPAEFYRLVYP
jgi:autotransporter-associated beta strand protein